MATRVGTPLDKGVAYFAAVSFAVPGWWLGILFILLFAFKLNWLPSGGMFSTPPPQGTWPRLVDLGMHALLPIITLVTVSVGPYIYTAICGTAACPLQTDDQIGGAWRGLFAQYAGLLQSADPKLSG